MAGAHRVGEPVGGSVLLRILPPALALALAAFLVVLGGRFLAGSATEVPAVAQLEAEDFVIDDDPFVSIEPASPDLASPDETSPDETSADLALPESLAEEPPPNVAEQPDPVAAAPDQATLVDANPVQAAQETAASRLVAPAQVAPPELETEGLQREAPREPLSQLGLALPPPPAPKNPWAGKPLFRPVAIESAVFESGGHTVAIEGVRSMAADETCSHGGETWSCGVRARAAFRAWLRGRALVCQIPEAEQENAVMRGKCRLAKQDVGGWLVENGWALADPDGPYAQAGEKARSAGLGVFGAPPDASSIPAVPEVPISSPSAMPSIMTEDGVDPQPPADPRLAFPPAPPPQ
ncbi:hypothetical protein ABMA32_06050 [Mesorhizobium sp. VNQ89]|uniref:thermonuclease family protein n=1 Tax=Mesorhizobium quangtriensis TaxID=3157709 RepID=UPI0032B7918B